MTIEILIEKIVTFAKNVTKLEQLIEFRNQIVNKKFDKDRLQVARFYLERLAQELNITRTRIHDLTNNIFPKDLSLKQLLNMPDEEFQKIIKANNPKNVNSNSCDNYYEDDYEREYRVKSAAQIKAEYKNQELVEDLVDKRETFAYIGTNKAKRRLNKLAKNSKYAQALRLLVEIEDKNITAKRYWGGYRTNAYTEKHDLIIKLTKIVKELDWVYGIQKQEEYSTNTIIYFDVPDCGQISWHITLDTKEELPIYTKKWDGLVNSTLTKIEKAVIEILESNNLYKKSELNEEEIAEQGDI